MSTRLTADQIRNLAPDAGSLKAGEGLTVPHKWRSLGRYEDLVWGECQGSGKDPYQTQADLSEPAFRCSCPSRKFPCKHAIGMLLMLARSEAQFAAGEPPAWVAEWMAARQRRAEQRAARPAADEGRENSREIVDRAAQERRASAREKRVGAGLKDLELWLADLVRGGLAEAATKSPAWWNEPAARLVDAQAPGLARRLREMGGIASSGEGWQRRLLEKIGELHLILSGYRRLVELPEATQSDLRAVIGWAENQEELLEQPGVKDRWAVLGSVVESVVGEEERLRVRRTWMSGNTSGREALLLDYAHTSQPLDPGLQPGTELDAELVFFPGACPLRALLKARHGAPAPIRSLPAAIDIDACQSAYASALALNPWIERFPCRLSAVIPVQRGGRWMVREAAGHALPLARRFAQGWEMLALSGGNPLGVFGEWDGEALRPLSIWAGGRLIVCGR